MPKIAITGKGGVGKTTLTSLLAYIYAERGQKVLAIDADPNANLASALGFPVEVATKIAPIADMQTLIYERTGAKPGEFGGFFRLNPRVDDIPDRFSAEWRGVRLLVMGTIKGGGTGCVCPESALLKNLVRHLLLQRSEVIILDMEAGIEHLGRGTAGAVDAMMDSAACRQLEPSLAWPLTSASRRFTSSATKCGVRPTGTSSPRACPTLG